MIGNEYDHKTKYEQASIYLHFSVFFCSLDASAASFARCWCFFYSHFAVVAAVCVFFLLYAVVFEVVLDRAHCFRPGSLF